MATDNRLRWGAIRADIGNPNQSLGIGQSALSQAGTVFGEMRKQMLEKEQQEWDRAHKEAQLAETIRSHQAKETHDADTLLQADQHFGHTHDLAERTFTHTQEKDRESALLERDKFGFDQEKWKTEQQEIMQRISTLQSQEYAATVQGQRTQYEYNLARELDTLDRLNLESVQNHYKTIALEAKEYDDKIKALKNELKTVTDPNEKIRIQNEITFNEELRGSATQAEHYDKLRTFMIEEGIDHTSPHLSRWLADVEGYAKFEIEQGQRKIESQAIAEQNRISKVSSAGERFNSSTYKEDFQIALKSELNRFSTAFPEVNPDLLAGAMASTLTNLGGPSKKNITQLQEYITMITQPNANMTTNSAINPLLNVVGKTQKGMQAIKQVGTKRDTAQLKVRDKAFDKAMSAYKQVEEDKKYYAQNFNPASPTEMPTGEKELAEVKKQAKMLAKRVGVPLDSIPKDGSSDVFIQWYNELKLKDKVN